MKKRNSNINSYKNYKNYLDATSEEYEVMNSWYERYEFDECNDYIYYYNSDGIRLCRTSDKNKIRQEKIDSILS
jgi:hypothetical protein